jgi:glutamate-1-semialdehyde 2,1-aminomutase
MMSAVRVARAFTGRNAILRFAGNYHGHFDLALLGAGASANTSDASTSGIPPGVGADVVVARYNDLDDVDEKLLGRADGIAAVLVEPIVGNMGYVPPAEGFLEGLRDRARRHGALLVFDEVITWLRFGLGGAQGRTGVRPDLTAIGKIAGGGVPFAAFGGRADVMNLLAPNGPVFTGGTHGGNPFSIGMAHRVLDLLEGHPEYYDRMRETANRLAEGIRAALVRHDLPYAVVNDESIVDFKFRAGAPNRNFDDALTADKRAYARYYHAMFERGILLPPSQNEVMFVSTAHTAADIDETIAAVEESLAVVTLPGVPA